MTISGVPGYSNPYSTQATGVAQAGAARPTDGDDDARVRQGHHEDGGDGDRGGMLGFMDSIFKALGQLGPRENRGISYQCSRRRGPMILPAVRLASRHSGACLDGGSTPAIAFQNRQIQQVR